MYVNGHIDKNKTKHRVPGLPMEIQESIFSLVLGKLADNIVRKSSCSTAGLIY